MQDVDGIVKFGHVHQPKCTICLLDAYLFCTCPHVIKRLPVIWIVTALHFAKLVPDRPPRILRKNFVIAQVFERRPDSVDWLVSWHRHDCIDTCTFLDWREEFRLDNRRAKYKALEDLALTRPRLLTHLSGPRLRRLHGGDKRAFDAAGLHGAQSGVSGAAFAGDALAQHFGRLGGGFG